MSVTRPYNSRDPVQRQLLFQSIRELPAGDYFVDISPRQKATAAQRGYLHGVVVPLAASLLTETQGSHFSDEEAWEYVKRLIRPREVADPVTGEVHVVGRSTRNLAKMELFTFTDELIQWLQDGGVDVPPPTKDYADAKAEARKEVTDGVI